MVVGLILIEYIEKGYIDTLICTLLDISCPSTANTDETFKCMDGTKCVVSGQDSSCCAAHGGTTNCPQSRPILCSAPKACHKISKDGKNKLSDYCCATNSNHCIAQGAGNPTCINGRIWFGYIYISSSIK